MEVSIDRIQAIETINTFLNEYNLIDEYIDTYEDETLQILANIITNKFEKYNDEEDEFE